jgi:hypothetical protein
VNKVSLTGQSNVSGEIDGLGEQVRFQRGEFSHVNGGVSGRNRRIELDVTSIASLGHREVLVHRKYVQVVIHQFQIVEREDC